MLRRTTALSASASASGDVVKLEASASSRLVTVQACHAVVWGHDCGRGRRFDPGHQWRRTSEFQAVTRLLAVGSKAMGARLTGSHGPGPQRRALGIRRVIVETHLTHVYTKLGLSSRVQLAQEAGRQAGESNRGRN